MRLLYGIISGNHKLLMRVFEELYI